MPTISRRIMFTGALITSFKSLNQKRNNLLIELEKIKLFLRENKEKECILSNLVDEVSLYGDAQFDKQFDKLVDNSCDSHIKDDDFVKSVVNDFTQLKLYVSNRQ